MPRMKVTLVKSSIGYKQDQKDTVRALGLRKMSQTVDLPANGATEGMVAKVRHLVRVERVQD